MATAAQKAALIVAAWQASDRSFIVPGTNISVSVTKDPEIVNGHVVLWLEITRGGVNVPLNNPFVFVNPPIRRPGDEVDRPRLAFLLALVETLKRVAIWRQ